MARDPEYNKKFKELEAQAGELGIEGIFAGSGKGLTPEDMAIELWKLGYLKIPTVGELLIELERAIAKRKQKTLKL